MRRLVVGDLHGSYKALVQVLERSEFDYDNDLLITIGDIVDGWSDSFKCVEHLLTIENRIDIIGNHDCMHPDTEFLTEKGWLKFDEIDLKTKVGQFNENGDIDFEIPLNRVEGYSKKLIKIEGNQTCQIVTPNHNVIINGEKVIANKLLGKTIKESNIRICGNHQDNSSPIIDDKMIEMITWVVCDGTLVYRKLKSGESKIKRIQFKLSKEKNNNLIKLLDELNFKYTIKKATMSGNNKLQPYLIRIYGDYARLISKYFLNEIKEFPLFFKNLNKHQAKLVYNTLNNTDGNVDKYSKSTMVSVVKRDLDILNEMFVKNDFESYISKRGKSGFKKSKLQHKLTFWGNKKSTRYFNLNINEVNHNGRHVCFTMPKGTLITRMNGKVAFTGNSWFHDFIDKGIHGVMWKGGGLTTAKSYAKAAGIDFKATEGPEGWICNLNSGDVPEEHKKFFRGQHKYYKDENDILFVHGGINPLIPLSEHLTYNLMWDRHLWSKHLSIMHGHSKKIDYIDDINRIFIGHTSTTISGFYEPVIIDKLINIDTGAGGSGYLSIMDVDTGDIWQSDYVPDLYPDEFE